MKKWVRAKVASLFAKMSEEIGKTLAEPSELHVHDLRTSVRRTRESLTVFEEFFPSAEARKSAQEPASADASGCGGSQSGCCARSSR